MLATQNLTRPLDQNGKKALSAGPLLALDVPTTKDGPRHFILICPMHHVYQPKEVIAMILSPIPSTLDWCPHL
jgi:hypothetical protein